MLCVQQWSDTGPVGRVRCWQVHTYCALQYNTEDQHYYENTVIHYAHLAILFIYSHRLMEFDQLYYAQLVAQQSLELNKYIHTKSIGLLLSFCSHSRTKLLFFKYFSDQP